MSNQQLEDAQQKLEEKRAVMKRKGTAKSIRECWQAADRLRECEANQGQKPMTTTPALPITPAKNAQFVKPVKRGRYWVAQNTTTDLYFKFPGSRHNISPDWVKDPSEAAGFSERWTATWAAAQYGFKEDTR